MQLGGNSILRALCVRYHSLKMFKRAPMLQCCFWECNAKTTDVLPLLIRVLLKSFHVLLIFYCLSKILGTIVSCSGVVTLFVNSKCKWLVDYWEGLILYRYKCLRLTRQQLMCCCLLLLFKDNEGMTVDSMQRRLTVDGWLTSLGMHW